MWGSIKMDVKGTVFEDLALDRVQWWVRVKTRIGAGLTHFWAQCNSKTWGSTHV